MKKSKPMSLNTRDYRKIAKDAVFFFLVPASFYLYQVQATILGQNHLLALADFIPNNATLISIVSWGIGQILNTGKKFVA